MVGGLDRPFCQIKVCDKSRNEVKQAPNTPRYIHTFNTNAIKDKDTDTTLT